MRMLQSLQKKGLACTQGERDVWSTKFRARAVRALPSRRTADVACERVAGGAYSNPKGFRVLALAQARGWG